MLWMLKCLKMSLFNQKSIRWWSLDESAIVNDMFVSTTPGRAIDQNANTISETTASKSNYLSVDGTNLTDSDDTNQIEEPIMTQGSIKIFFNKAFKPTTRNSSTKQLLITWFRYF